MTREEYESWLRVEKEVIFLKTVLVWQVLILNWFFQVAALKRNLQLEEMRQFRQMSRPSFQLKPREDQFENDEVNEESKSVPR